ncbi:hypothetical protein [Alkalihalophilus marmarensis]|uniref:hypothetical protein n=1 Tax=Alkalihalophilus marmarensis TaxID=521377 RepID=UPI002DB7788B|nr:hypothetical protein [Alkalihalophilus marmarensis]MEC2074423.1 hypothetical protein [Alkalihalophilus marmarensis]
MPIFFPDNDKRKTRLIELATDTQNYLHDAANEYQEFKALLDHVNSQVASIYKEANLGQPNVQTVDVLKALDAASTVESEETLLKISEVIVDVTGFIGTVKYLAPGATRLLVRSGVMSAERAAQQLTRFVIPVIGREVEITVGDLAGNIIGGVIGGVAVAGIDLGLDAIEGSIAKGQLRSALHDVYPLRTSTKISLDQSKELKASLKAVKTTLDTISGAGIPLTEEMIKKLIANDIQPSIEATRLINETSVVIHLKQLDHDRHSWNVEDEH